MRIVRLSITVSEETWQRLRRIAEYQRVGGRASVSSVVRRAIDKAVAEAGGGNPT
jgi:hypothetical protein